MSRILFIGRPDKGYFIEEIVNSKQNDGWSIKYYEVLNGLSRNTMRILMETNSGYDYIVYDTEAFIEDGDIIAESIYQIYKSNSVTPIVMVSTLNEKNVVVKACLNKQIRNFINTGVGTTADLKEQFIKIVTGFYDGNGRQVVEQTEKAVVKLNDNIKNVITIGVAGSCHRIGTTTQAIQITKYLNVKGYNACLVECNTNRYCNRVFGRSNDDISFFEKTRFMMEITNDDEKRGFFKIEGIDIFYKPEHLSEILASGYDYIVYDYGVYSDLSFNKTAFLKDNKQIFCVGGNLSEVDYAIEVAENTSYKNSKLLFTFTAENEKADMLELFEIFDTERLFFAGYTPNPYALTDISLYDNLLQIEEKPNISEEKVEKKPKKRTLFKLKKKEVADGQILES